MQKLKHQYFGHLMRRADSWEKTLMLGGIGAGGEGDNRGCNGWMASPTRWTWVWVNSRSWWWTGRPCVLRFMGSQRVGHYWATELNWSELKPSYSSGFNMSNCTMTSSVFSQKEKKKKTPTRDEDNNSKHLHKNLKWGSLMCVECFMYIKPAKQSYKVNVITVSSITVKKIEHRKRVRSQSPQFINGRARDWLVFKIQKELASCKIFFQNCSASKTS